MMSLLQGGGYERFLGNGVYDYWNRYGFDRFSRPDPEALSGKEIWLFWGHDIDSVNLILLSDQLQCFD